MLLAAFDRHLSVMSENDSVLVACSGGLDSVVLLDVAIDRLGCPRVTAGHVDHSVRPGSDRDAGFVAELAAQLGVSCLRAPLEPGPSDEATLRDKRYAALEAQRIEAGASWILTAHHADDQAETVLLGLIRRTTPASLAGIPARRDHILRPLLEVPRAELVEWAERRGLRWRDDPTNAEPRYLRNRIRRELLPLLEARYRPGLRKRLAKLAAGMERPTPVPTNRREGHRVVVPCEPGIQFRREPYDGGPLGDGKVMARFDAARIDTPVVRQVRAGDRIRPFGMDGRRKLQDVLGDAKVPKDRRWQRLVVASSDGAVLWVPGLLRSAEAPVTDETREVWTFRLEPACETGRARPCGPEPDRSM